uniref:Uncharacterized protein n=1 Tax=Bursaphelenchus xylophilus TaxID=6326 RepID=A0A1I7SKG0_BURXY
MDSIFVRVNGKVVKVEVDTPGEIGVNTLRMGFLLERDLPMSLRKDGVVLKCRREGEDDIFVLGHNWKDQIFDLEWDESRRSRPISSVIAAPTAAEAFYRLQWIALLTLLLSLNALATSYYVTTEAS